MQREVIPTHFILLLLLAEPLKVADSFMLEKVHDVQEVNSQQKVTKFIFFHRMKIYRLYSFPLNVPSEHENNSYPIITTEIIAREYFREHIKDY